MLAVAVVLRERVVHEHVVHGGAPDINDVALLAVGVVFTGTATVVIHLFKLTVNAQHKTDARHDMRIVAITFPRKLNVNMALRGNLPAIGTTHAKIENRRSDNAAGGDNHRVSTLFGAEFTQMLLHNLQVTGLPQPLIFLLVVINHRLEEVNLRLTGHLVYAVHLPFAQFAADFREDHAEVMPGDAVAQSFINYL